MAGFWMTLDFELLLVGFILLALCLVPVRPVQAVGTFVVRLLYKLHIHSPVPSLVRGTVSLLLLVGVWGLLSTAYCFLSWYNQYVAVLTPVNMISVLDNGKRWREERNIYMWASTAVVYLTLHTIARLGHEASAASPARGGAVPAPARATGTLDDSSARPSAAPAGGETLKDR